MAVYIDDYEARYRGMRMCHMIADSTDELLAMADSIGVQRKWIQFAGTPKEHFDVCVTKKQVAVMHGALLITFRELSAKVSARKSLTQNKPIKEYEKL